MFLEQSHDQESDNQSLNVLFLHLLQFAHVILHEVRSQKVLLRFLPSQQFHSLLSRNFRIVVCTLSDETHYYLGFFLSIHLYNLQIFPAVVAHAFAVPFVEVFPEEVELHLPATYVGFLTVLQYGVEPVHILVFALGSVVMVRNDKEVILFAVAILVVEDAFGC